MGTLNRHCEPKETQSRAENANICSEFLSRGAGARAPAPRSGEKNKDSAPPVRRSDPKQDESTRVLTGIKCVYVDLIDLFSARATALLGFTRLP